MINLNGLKILKFKTKCYEKVSYKSLLQCKWC